MQQGARNLHHVLCGTYNATFRAPLLNSDTNQFTYEYDNSASDK